MTTEARFVFFADDGCGPGGWAVHLVAFHDGEPRWNAELNASFGLGDNGIQLCDYTAHDLGKSMDEVTCANWRKVIVASLDDHGIAEADVTFAQLREMHPKDIERWERDACPTWNADTSRWQTASGTTLLRRPS